MAAGSSTESKKLRICVIHGYVQTAETVKLNTIPMQQKLEDIADFTFAEGPPAQGTARPWWGLGQDRLDQRWHETVTWWSEHLSHNQYDGVIGLSQGSTMASLLVSMLNDPSKVQGFNPQLQQPLKFAILSSGFKSSYPEHQFLKIPKEFPTFHTICRNDSVVPAFKTEELARYFDNPLIKWHNEGHSIPVGPFAEDLTADVPAEKQWPDVFREFILNITQRK